MHRILVLGSGLVAKPLVEYLLTNGYQVTIASNTPEAAEKIINNNRNGSTLFWDATDTKTLERLIGESSLTVSLLPYSFHPSVARICISLKKPMVTTSYVSEKMLSMDSDARSNGVLILNEIGLDPGIDHMSAMRIIDTIHSKGGDVKKFYSICGALPSPENADNPMRYKFSWSPRGVVLASKNSAKYLKDGKVVSVEPVNLFKDRFFYNIESVGEMEVYPNRDSISYIDIYGIPETETIFRGTFRFPGWCETLDAMKELNMLSDTSSDYTGMSFSQFIESLLPKQSGNFEERVADHLKISTDSVAMDSLRWLGFFSEEKMGYGNSTPFEITSDQMIKKMMLGKEERDMIVLQHLFLASYPENKSEVISSHMVDYGSPKTNTSIARTVGLPAAIAVKMILEGKIGVSGVHRPIIPEIYNPVLDELEQMNIKLIEEFGLPLSAMIE
jgi:saccharopine dehydrogenase-like NADP-dependent oxidoreductase